MQQPSKGPQKSSLFLLTQFLRASVPVNNRILTELRIRGCNVCLVPGGKSHELVELELREELVRLLREALGEAHNSRYEIVEGCTSLDTCIQLDRLFSWDDRTDGENR